jgi:hypothetical protein
LGGNWVNLENNFDNIFNSIAVLSKIITATGWVEVMNDSMDSRDIGL